MKLLVLLRILSTFALCDSLSVQKKKVTKIYGGATALQVSQSNAKLIGGIAASAYCVYLTALPDLYLALDSSSRNDKETQLRMRVSAAGMVGYSYLLLKGNEDNKSIVEAVLLQMIGWFTINSYRVRQTQSLAAKFDLGTTSILGLICSLALVNVIPEIIALKIVAVPAALYLAALLFVPQMYITLDSGRVDDTSKRLVRWLSADVAGLLVWTISAIQGSASVSTTALRGALAYITVGLPLALSRLISTGTIASFLDSCTCALALAFIVLCKPSIFLFD